MNLNIFGPINYLGTGRHCYGLAKAFKALGHQICLRPPFGRVDFQDEFIKNAFAQEFFDINPSLMIFDIDFFPNFAGNPRIGFAVFETGGFTLKQLNSLACVDFIFTPSKWGESVLNHYGFYNVFVIPEGFDPVEFPIVKSKDGVFTFIHVGKFEERKGTLQTLRCFTKALEGKEAKLIMHIHNPFLNPVQYKPIHEWLQNELRYVTFDGIHYRKMGLTIDFTTPLESTALLYAQADCGLFPTKGEAWGLPILECLASGIPAICGNWTGQTEYLQEGNSWAGCLAVYNREIANDGIWYHGDRGSWNVPDDANLIEEIKNMFENSGELRASEGYQEIIDHYRSFTWENAAKKMEKVLKYIL